jgi:hypothetical protein
LKKVWAKPHVIGTPVSPQQAVNKETGVSPFEFVFGSVDAEYMRLPEQSKVELKAGTYLKILNDNLKTIREEATIVQEREQEKRQEVGAGANEYQVGDFVLRKVKKMVDKDSKLQPL